MTLIIDLTKEQESRLEAAAKRQGPDPHGLIQKWVDQLPELRAEAEDPTIEFARRRLAQAPTDPSSVQEAERELEDFMRNMNRPRKESGARLLYPDVE